MSENWARGKLARTRFSCVYYSLHFMCLFVRHVPVLPIHS
jgi:hypothetical protein